MFQVVSIINILINYLFFILNDNDLVWFGFIGLIIQMCLYYSRLYNRNRRRFKTWTNPSYLLTLGLLVVSFQRIVDVELGIIPFELFMRGGKQYASYIPKVLSLSLLSMNVFFIGLDSYKYQFKLRHNNSIESTPEFVFVIAQIIAFALFVYFSDIYSLITGMSYVGSGSYDRKVSVSDKFEILYNNLFIIYLSVKVFNSLNSNKVNFKLKDFLFSLGYPFWSCYILYFVLRLLSGDRGPLIYTAFAIFTSAVIVTHYRMKFRLLFMIIVVGAFSMNVVNVYRSFASEGGSIIQKFQRSFGSARDAQSESFSPFTSELANSANCNFIAVNDIDKDITNFGYGKYTLWGALTALPGSSSFFKNVFDIDVRKNNTLDYITTSYFGLDYPIGLGTTPLADFYLELGVLGILIGFFVLGYIFSIIDTNIIYLRKMSVGFIIFIIKLSSISIYIPRSSLTESLKSVIYCLVIYGLINIFFLFKKSKTNANLKQN